MFVTFTLDNFGITQTRSKHNDTDNVYISATVGANPTVVNWRPIGDVNNGTHQVGLSVEADIPNDDTIVVLIYGIVNNGHANNDAVEKSVTTAFSTLAKAVVNNKEATAEISIATVAGLAVIPFVGSFVAGLSMLVIEAAGIGAILFPDCDGTVASGALRFTASELIRRTGSGHKITDTVEHHGTTSPDFCNHSNSQYVTTVTLTTTASIQTVIDLNGEWERGGVPGPFITRTGNSISIDMSASRRPTAAGTILNSSRISVKFPDDKTTYTGTLQAPNLIKWSDNSSWAKVQAITTLFDLNGKWMSGGVLGPVITVHGNSIAIDMSATHRPAASGSVIDASRISVKFPDDKSYTATLEKPDALRWSDNSVWTKFAAGKIKHLFVLMLENRSFDHMLGFSKITGTDAETGQPRTADGLTERETNVYESETYGVSTTAPDRLDPPGPPHQFNDVLISLCGPEFDKRELNKQAYPKVVGTGYAAAFGIITDKKRAGEVMRCFSKADLPVLNTLASEFVLCDAWFSSMAGPTEPNRMFVHAATSGVWDNSPDGLQQTRDEIGNNDIKFANGTIYDRLRKANIPFRIYAGDVFPNVGLLHGVSINNDVEDFANFQGDINNPAFDAVAYTFIEPSYDALANNFKDGNSQHPLGSARAGEQLIKQVYEIIRQSPRWTDSMLVVTWDEHGGFYDHVSPPKTAPTGEVGQKHGFLFDQLGPRVPAVVISPWCPKNRIEHRKLEHSVVPATIEQLFNVPPLTVRDRALTGLQSLATLTSPRADTPLTLPNATVRPAVEMAVARSRPRPVGAARYRQKRLGALALAHCRQAPSRSRANRERVNNGAGERDQYARRSHSVHGQRRRGRDGEKGRNAQGAGRRVASPARGAGRDR